MCDPLKLASRLIDCGNVDTVYRDVYLQRARTLLAGVLRVEEFRRIEEQEAELGEAEGWGRQPFWTHFDGYLVMADGRLRALVGGDVRFGGLYDVLGIGETTIPTV